MGRRGLSRAEVNGRSVWESALAKPLPELLRLRDDPGRALFNAAEDGFGLKEFNAFLKIPGLSGFSGFSPSATFSP